jgi:hypothetical protein
MKGIVVLALAFQALALTGAGAGTVSVPLPMIQGRYYVDESIPAMYYNRQDHFELARIPLSVSGVWLHISGTFAVGETSCWLSDPADPDTFPQSLEFFASLDDTTGAWDPMADAVSGTVSGAFEYTMPFSRASHEVNWEFLKAGYGLLDMSITLGMFPECSVLLWPEATIEHAELIIEGEFPVAVEHSTWGSIKSLFR